MADADHPAEPEATRSEVSAGRPEDPEPGAEREGASGNAPSQAPGQDADTSALRLLLLVGGSCVFLGALWLVWFTWGDLPPALRWLAVVGLTAASGAAAWWTRRTGFDEVSGALTVLFGQMFWGVGGLSLVLLRLDEDDVAWAVVAGAVVAVNAGLRHRQPPQRGGLRLALEIAGWAAAGTGALLLQRSTDGLSRVLFHGSMALVFAALFQALPGRGEGSSRGWRWWLCGLGVLQMTWAAALGVIALVPLHGWSAALAIAATWSALSAFANLNGKGLTRAAHTLGAFVWLGAYPAHLGWDRVAIACVLPAVCLSDLILARRAGDRRAEDGARVSLTVTLWIVGPAIAQARATLSLDTLVIIGVVAWAAALALSDRGRRRGTSFAAAVHLAVAALFLGERLRTGWVYGPPLYTFVVEALFVVLALRVLPVARWIRDRSALRAAHLALAALFAALSMWASFALLAGGQTPMFGTLFPLVPPGLLLVAAGAVPTGDEARAPLRAVSLLLWAMWPSLLVLAQPTSMPHVLLAAFGTVGVLTALLFAERWGPAPGTSTTLTTLRSTAWAWAAPWLLVAMGALVGAPSSSRVAWLVGLVTLTGGALIASAMRQRLVPEDRAPLTLQTLAGGSFLGLMSLACQGRIDDGGYALVLLGGAAALIAFGIAVRHRRLVFTSTGVFLVTLTVEFFVHLHGRAPLALLLILFGVAVLLGAWLYERGLKRWLDDVRRWP